MDSSSQIIEESKYVSSKIDRVTEETPENKASSGPKIKQRKQIPKGHKVGILHNSYPDKLLSNEQVALVQEAILKKVAEQADEKIKPKFLKSNIQIGWLLISCADRDTVEWLKGLNNCLKPWQDAKLIIVEEDNIPSAQIFKGNFPISSETNIEILRYLKAQNAGLNTENWTINKTKQKRKMMEIEFIVDLKSAEQLKVYNGRVSFKFSQIKLRPGSISKQLRDKIQQQA